VISSSHRPLPDNTQQTYIHAPGGIRNQDRSRRAALDLRLRPHGHWDRHMYVYIYTYMYIQYIHRTLTLTFKSLVSFNFSFACLQSIFMCFLKFSQRTPIVSLRQINRILLLMDMQCDVCPVGTDLLYFKNIHFKL
jgi:hypothetical protein